MSLTLTHSGSNEFYHNGTVSNLRFDLAKDSFFMMIHGDGTTFTISENVMDGPPLAFTIDGYYVYDDFGDSKFPFTVEEARQIISFAKSLL